MIQRTGLRIHGLRSMGIRGELRRDGQAGEMVYLPENSRARLTERGPPSGELHRP